MPTWLGPIKPKTRMIVIMVHVIHVVSTITITYLFYFTFFILYFNVEYLLTALHMTQPLSPIETR